MYLAICTTILVLSPEFMFGTQSHFCFDVAMSFLCYENCISNLMFCCKRSFWRVIFFMCALCVPVYVREYVCVWVYRRSAAMAVKRNRINVKRDRRPKFIAISFLVNISFHIKYILLREYTHTHNIIYTHVIFDDFFHHHHQVVVVEQNMLRNACYLWFSWLAKGK